MSLLLRPLWPVEVEPSIVVPDYMLTSDYLAREKPAAGQDPTLVSTANIAIRLADLAGERVGPAPFESACGRSGGEDTNLSLRVRAMGGRLAYCHETELAESLPAHRCSLETLRKRWRRDAANLARSNIAVHHRPPVERLMWAGRGTARVAYALSAAWIVGGRHGEPRAVAAQRWWSLGTGMIAGSLGHVARAYGVSPTPG